MARIPMTSGFTLIPEGTYVFRIYDVKYDETFGKLSVMMVNAQGMKHTENFSVTDIDHTDIIGHYIRAEVVHTKMPSRKDPTKTVTFANLGDKSPADGF